MHWIVFDLFFLLRDSENDLGHCNFRNLAYISCAEKMSILSDTNPNSVSDLDAVWQYKRFKICPVLARVNEFRVTSRPSNFWNLRVIFISPKYFGWTYLRSFMLAVLLEIF